MQGFGNFGQLNLAEVVLVGTGFLFQTGQAVLFVPVIPGAEGAPGKPVRDLSERIGKGLIGHTGIVRGKKVPGRSRVHSGPVTGFPVGMGRLDMNSSPWLQ